MERRNIKFPLWRKHVDGSIFKYSSTPIPDGITKTSFDFGKRKKKSKKSGETQVRVFFEKVEYNGWLVFTGNNTRASMWFLRFPDDLVEALSKTFVMSHMRYLEYRLEKNAGEEVTTAQMERRIPFSETLDIEWDKESEEFHLYARYQQDPEFRFLFDYFRSNHILSSIDREISGKAPRVSGSKWKDRVELEQDRLIPNAIYTLVDTTKKEIYIGQTREMGARFGKDGHRKEIPGWDKYRVDVLPSSIGKQERECLEMELIRSIASLCVSNKSSKEFDSLGVFDFTLTNKDIRM